MMSRYVMHVVHRKGDGRWHVEEHEGASIGAFETRDEAELAGRMRATRLHEDGRDGRLVVHLEDGAIEAEYVYGPDATAVPVE